MACVRYVGVAIILTGTISCGGSRQPSQSTGSDTNRLTRSKAAEAIRSSKLLSDKIEGPVFKTGKAVYSTDQGPETEPMIAALKKLGYLKVEQEGPVRPRDVGFGDLVDFRVSLTPKGESAAKEWRVVVTDAPYYYVPIAGQEFVDVTGISGGDPAKGDSAIVQFTSRWDLTPIGRQLTEAGLGNYAGGYSKDSLKKVSSGEASFRLYDDGWRIQGIR